MGERTVWVEVSTELLAEMGEWSEPVQVRIENRRRVVPGPDGHQVEMAIRRAEAAE